jgi:hypothetical protein
MRPSSSPSPFALGGAAALLSLLALLSAVQGCTCASPAGGDCTSDEDCAADPDPCFERYCAHPPGSSRPGICTSVPRPGCGDTGADAPGPTSDVPTRDVMASDVPMDTAGADVPALDTAGDTRSPTGVTPCPPPPIEVVDRERDTPGTFDAIAILCLRPAADACFLTTTVVGSIPPDPTECPVEDLALLHASSEEGAPILRANAAFSFAAADVPVQVSTGRALLRTGFDTVVVLEHTATRELWRVELEARDGAALWRTVVPFTGAAPEYGQAHACLGEPHEYTTSVASPAGEAFVRICDERRVLGMCTVHGDVEGSPESESCDAYVVELGYLTGPPRAPYARTVSGAAYDILTTTHGTLTTSGNSVTGQPEDTDVTMTASNGSHEIEIVARWSGDRVTASVRAR